MGRFGVMVYITATDQAEANRICVRLTHQLACSSGLGDVVTVDADGPYPMG